MRTKTNKSLPFPLLAMLLAWVIPGAGHAYLGRYKRAVIVFVTIGATFWAGMAMGGQLTMDYHAERWWFMAQMLAGAHGMIGWEMQNRLYSELLRDAGAGQEFQHLRGRGQSAEQSVIDKWLSARKQALTSPTDTVARAYAGVAGLLNLMCVFDAVMLALMGITGERRKDQDAPQPQEAGN